MAIYMYFFPMNTGMDFVFGSNMVMIETCTHGVQKSNMIVTCLVSKFPFQVTWPGLSGAYPPNPLSSVRLQGRTPPEKYGETAPGSLLLQHEEEGRVVE